MNKPTQADTETHQSSDLDHLKYETGKKSVENGKTNDKSKIFKKVLKVYQGFQVEFSRFVNRLEGQSQPQEQNPLLAKGSACRWHNCQSERPLEYLPRSGG